MRTIECIKLGSVVSLTVGNVYEIISETENRYSILNDKGVQANYGKNLFGQPREVRVAQPQEAMEVAVPAPRRRAPRQAPAPAPVPAPPVVIDSIEVDVQKSIRNSHFGFSITINLGEFGNYSRAFNERSATYGTESSCGISAFSGIDSVFGSFRAFQDGFRNHLDENTARFTLGEGISLDEVFTETAKALVQELISSHQGEDAPVTRAGLLIVSTTENSANSNTLVATALEEVAEQTIRSFNPNSGNDIITWILNCNE